MSYELTHHKKRDAWGYRGPGWSLHVVWMSERGLLGKAQAERIVEILNADLERHEKKFGVK